LVVCITHISSDIQEHALRAMLYVVEFFCFVIRSANLCYKKVSMSKLLISLFYWRF